MAPLFHDVGETRKIPDTLEDVLFEIGWLEVGRAPGVWEAVVFQSPVAKAVVFLTPQPGRTRSQWLNMRVKEVTDYGFKYAHFRADKAHAGSTRVKVEKVGWLAVPGGLGTINGHRYMAATTRSAVLDENAYTISDGKQQTWSQRPALFTYMQTTNEADSAVLRTTSFANDGEFTVFVDESTKCGWGGTRSVREKLGWLLIERSSKQFYIGDPGKLCLRQHEIGSQAECQTAFDAIKADGCCTSTGGAFTFSKPSSRGMQTVTGTAAAGIPLGCSAQHAGTEVTNANSADPFFNTEAASDNSRMSSKACSGGSGSCDEFRALCSYGRPLGAPQGAAQFSAATNVPDTFFAFQGIRLGVKVPKTKAQMQRDCISACRQTSPDYGFYLLSDRTACLCSKTAITASEDPSKCHENEVWAMTKGPGPGTTECGAGVTTEAECQDTLGCCYEPQNAIKCVYPRLVTKGKATGRCVRCDENKDNCWTARLCYPKYCPYPARGRMPWTHKLSVSCKQYTTITGIPLLATCTFECKSGYISNALDYKCQVTEPYVGIGAVSAIAVAQPISMINLKNEGNTKFCLRPEGDTAPAAGTKVLAAPCADIATRWNLPSHSVGKIEYRFVPNNKNTALCMSGDYDNSATDVTLEACDSADKKQKWFVPDDEGRIRSGDVTGTGTGRKCIEPVGGASPYYLRLTTCYVWFDYSNVVYYQDYASGSRWGASVANFDANMKEVAGELKCIPKLCSTGIFPKVPTCSGGAVPSTCIDVGMGHDCAQTTVGFQCQITCATGYAFKCYTDSTFTVFDVDPDGRCPYYRCPALNVALGSTEIGLEGRLATQELVNTLKSTDLVRCEPQPCIVESDPAFRFKGARSDCTYLTGVGGTIPTPRNPPSNSSYPATGITSRVIGELCIATCDVGYAPTTAMYQCYKTLRFAPAPGGSDISCSALTCMQLPSSCMPSADLTTMNLAYLSEKSHSRGATLCTEKVGVPGTSRPHGGGSCYSFLVEQFGQTKTYPSSHANLAGKDFKFATVPNGCSLEVRESDGSTVTKILPGPAFDLPVVPYSSPTLKVQCNVQPSNYFSKFRDDASWYASRRIDLVSDPTSQACSERFGEGLVFAGCMGLTHGQSCDMSCRDG